MRPQILIAEDDEASRQVLATTFALELGDGFDVVEAENGQVALECIRRAVQAQLRCVMTDFDMPFVKGVEVVNAAFDAAVPNVVLMTARDQSSLVSALGTDGKRSVQALLAKGMKYFQKPLDLDEIVREIIDPLRKKV